MPAAQTEFVSGAIALAGRLDARFFELLAALATTGSLHQAARAAGYSYKGAWLVLEAAGNLARSPLLQTAPGRRGGTQPTEAALQLLAAWRELQRRQAEFLHAQDAWVRAQPALAGLLKRMTMKTSARNQFVAEVLSIQATPVMAEVLLSIGGGAQISAAVPSAALAPLRLKAGAEVIALVKASEIVLVAGAAPASRGAKAKPGAAATPGWKVATRNQLAGIVARIEKGAVTSLVGLKLAGGQAVTASVTNAAVEALGLSVGQGANAVFAETAVLLAVAE
jgi:molybdate transport system regulatory protein